MNRSALLAVILVLSFLGIADAWYLAQAALTDTPLLCGVESIDGCNTVAQSEYSRFLGVPLGAYGVLFYAAIFALAAIALVRHSRTITRLVISISALGLFASAYFLYLQVFVINALCIYCIVSAAIALLVFIASVLLSRRTLRAGAEASAATEPQGTRA